MGMKEARGKALKIMGTCSTPKDVDQYTKTSNSSSVAKNNVNSDLNLKNSNMPPTKSSGKPKVF